MWPVTEAQRTREAMEAAEEPSLEEVEEDEEEEETEEVVGATSEACTAVAASAAPTPPAGGEGNPGRRGRERGPAAALPWARGAREEQFVLVELSGIIDSDFLSKCENKCKILGIDTERPILQVDSYVFAGEYEDTLGTCVIFEENVEHVDGEGSDKTVLKYKCHTMKKLGMTRTLLTEKKEGEENIGGVEWLQMKDNDFSYRPNMICSFVHENEDEVVAPAPDKPLELEEQQIQMKDHSNLIYEQEKPLHLETEDSGPFVGNPSEMEGSVFMETQDAALEITPR